jgi:hypothetical protein
MTLMLALGCASAASTSEKKRPKKKPAAYDYEKSRYKAYKALVDEPRTYRFDERGNPIAPPAPGKKGAKKSKAAPPQAEEAPPKPACEQDNSCGPGDEKPADEPKSSQPPVAE